MERAVEIAILLLAPWPLVRLLLARPFHERLAAHPGLLAGVVAGVAGAAGLVVLLALGPPWPLRVAAGLAVVASLLAWWRARPGYGVARGLPPGSLALTQLGLVQDDRFLLRQAERHGPVFKIAHYGRPMACVVGLRRGAELLREAGDGLVSGALPFSRLIPGGFIRYMPPAEHARYRALLVRALPGDMVHAAAPAIDAAAVRAFGSLAAAGGAGVSPIPGLHALTLEVLVGLLFGIGPDDPRLARMRELYPALAVPSLARAGLRRAEAAMAELTVIAATAAAEAQARRAAGATPACALDHLVAEGPAVLADPTLTGNLVYMVETGGRDTAGLLAWCLKMLADHPAWRRRLAEAARGDGAADLAGRIAAETLRLEQSEYVIRRAARPVRIGEHRIPAGWLVRICVRESHRDPALFAEPERFDPDRFLERRPGPAEYAPLGMGGHTCLGRSVVQVTAATALTVLARDFDWRPVADGPRECGAFHWMPSARFAIRVERTPTAAPVAADGRRVVQPT
ncbi:MAG: cytochrome P450 [Geminicoccaceae bacterium]